jgi:hypothetical protein
MIARAVPPAAMKRDAAFTLGQRWRTLAAIAVALAVSAAVTGCRTSTQNVMTYEGQLPRPQLIVVYDFTSMPGEAQLDSGVMSRLRESMQGTPLTEQQLQLRQKVTGIMTAQLVQEIQKLGFPAQPAPAPPGVAGPTLSIEGQFLTIDEGNRTRRLLIGLGAGASHVRVAVQVFEAVSGEQRLVEDFYTNAQSSRKPGFGPMAGVGAATGAAAETTAAGVGAGVVMGPQDAENDTKRAAVAVTKQLAQFFAKQGWITSEQAERYSLIP